MGYRHREGVEDEEWGTGTERKLNRAGTARGRKERETGKGRGVRRRGRGGNMDTKPNRITLKVLKQESKPKNNI